MDDNRKKYPILAICGNIDYFMTKEEIQERVYEIFKDLKIVTTKEFEELNLKKKYKNVGHDLTRILGAKYLKDNKIHVPEFIIVCDKSKSKSDIIIKVSCWNEVYMQYSDLVNAIIYAEFIDGDDYRDCPCIDQQKILKMKSNEVIDNLIDNDIDNTMYEMYKMFKEHFCTCDEADKFGKRLADIGYTDFAQRNILKTNKGYYVVDTELKSFDSHDPLKFYHNKSNDSDILYTNLKHAGEKFYSMYNSKWTYIEFKIINSDIVHLDQH